MGLVYIKATVFWRSLSICTVKDCGKVMVARMDQLPVIPWKQIPTGLAPADAMNFCRRGLVFDTWPHPPFTPQINGRWEEENDRGKRF